jgi:hypothetical protein
VLAEAAGKGHTHNNFPVRIAGPAPAPGTLLACRVTGQDGETLDAVPI